MAITLHVLYVQWNPVNTDTKGTCHFVCIIQVSVLGGLSEKNVPNTCFNNIILQHTFPLENACCLVSQLYLYTTRSSKRKKAISNDCSKKPMKWNCNRRQKTLLKYKSTWVEH